MDVEFGEFGEFGGLRGTFFSWRIPEVEMCLLQTWLPEFNASCFKE
jgi:hypothetical protein